VFADANASYEWLDLSIYVFIATKVFIVIEVEVHQKLRAFLRERGQPCWPHHLTMARLVARALRLGRSALIQTGVPPLGVYGRHRLSYLAPALVWQEAAVVVAEPAVQQRLLMVEVPQLRQWLDVRKPIQIGDRWPSQGFQGLLITSPQAWLADRLGDQSAFPAGVPTLIDGVDDLENWAFEQLRADLTAACWRDLILALPACADRIRDLQAALAREIFHRPANPYQRHLLEETEQNLLLILFGELLAELRNDLMAGPEPLLMLPPAWQRFWQRFDSGGSRDERLVWATVDREHGQFALHCAPVEISAHLAPVWPQQPVVLMGTALEVETEALLFRQRIGLGSTTCLKFNPDRQHEAIQLYLPDGLPMPNTPHYQPVLLQEVNTLLHISHTVPGFTVLLVGDVPLKAQLGSALAAEFGSRVQVETTGLDDNGVLVTGWQFWQEHQAVLPMPRLMVIATLPIPSLEDPIVAGRVAHYKRLKQDWFRLYLLPDALSKLQRAIAPVRESQGVVALLDNRVLRRSYGQQVLAAMSPLARINYLSPDLLSLAGS